VRKDRIRFHPISIFSIAALFILLSSMTAMAGTITGWSVTGSGGVAQVFLPVNTIPDNDNSDTPGDNLIVVVKRIDFLSPIHIDFTVAPDGNRYATEYEIVEFVDNNTGVDWYSYTFQIIPELIDDGLDFDTPNMDPIPSSTAFSTILHLEDMLMFSGGLHSPGAESYIIRIDVPDNISSFTLMQSPAIVPEPGTLAMMVIGLALSAIGLRKRWSKTTNR
jgi:hypothetical protein